MILIDDSFSQNRVGTKNMVCQEIKNPAISDGEHHLERDVFSRGERLAWRVLDR